MNPIMSFFNEHGVRQEGRLWCLFAVVENILLYYGVKVSQRDLIFQYVLSKPELFRHELRNHFLMRRPDNPELWRSLIEEEVKGSNISNIKELVNSTLYADKKSMRLEKKTFNGDCNIIPTISRMLQVDTPIIIPIRILTGGDKDPVHMVIAVEIRDQKIICFDPEVRDFTAWDIEHVSTYSKEILYVHQ
jgi:hypothetical protein